MSKGRARRPCRACIPIFIWKAVGSPGTVSPTECFWEQALAKLDARSQRPEARSQQPATSLSRMAERVASLAGFAAPEINHRRRIRTTGSEVAVVVTAVGSAEIEHIAGGATTAGNDRGHIGRIGRIGP